jgi:2-polyprenyl-3-methyl-5-hydroxy-6-metoxy-1,4-benzoquinol methylase
MNSSDWEKAQGWEREWWSNCANTVWEDVKQIGLAKYLGLKIVPNTYTNYRIPMNGEVVLDIGGGPSSLLLKCENVSGTVVDPCDYPSWVEKRYEECGIEYLKLKGEDISEDTLYDEVWIYNCLQHTDDPKKIIRNAQKAGKIIRIFEWINTGVNEGHLHSFNRKFFDKLLKGDGKVVNLNNDGLYGEAYCGVFLGDSYDRQAKR